MIRARIAANVPPPRPVRVPTKLGKCIGARLVKIRTKHGLSMNAVSKEIGISHQALWQIEAGITLPSLDTLIALARYYDISTDIILSE